ncbi:Uncharacterised protein [Serratia liquefaciens]|nr:Uncharacterised protein [Serratia liquefaciens]
MELNLKKKQTREMNLSTNEMADSDNRTLLLSFSSELPYERCINGQYLNEILL